jgi:phosphatidate cytidylyltransferase
LVLCICHLYRRPPTISGIAIETFGLLYVGFLGSHVIQLRALPAGSGHIILLFVCVWLTDTGAYLVGSGFGRWKLSPRLSPGKTVEGAVAGLLFAVMGAVLLKQMQIAGKGPPMPPYTMLQYIGVAVLASVVGQAGDLVESAFKRDAKIKDSGALFPGHGGVLDRCDSLLFAAPVLYYYAKLMLK